MRVPVYERRVDPTSSGGPAVRPDPTGLGTGLQDLGKAIGGAFAGIADMVERRREADRTITAITTQTAAMKELGDLETAYAEDPDWAGAEDKYREKARTIAESYAPRFEGDERRAAEFAQTMERLTAGGALKLRTLAKSKRTDAAMAATDDFTARAKLIIATGNPVQRDEATRLVDEGIKAQVEAGLLTAEDGGKSWRDFNSDVSEGDVLGAIRTDPARALAELQDPGKHQGLTPVARERQLKAAQARVDGLLAENDRQQARADRAAEKALRQQGDAAEKEMFSRAEKGALSREWLDANRGALSPSAYHAGLTALHPKAEDLPDDRDTVLGFEERVDREDIKGDVLRAMREGRVSTKTGQKYLDKNRELRGDDRPDSPRKRGREHLALKLGGEGVTFSDPAVAGQVASRKADALDEYDLWLEQNPNATPEQARVFYRDLADRAQALTLGDAELSLVAPRYHRAPRAAITLESLDQAEAQALADYDAKRLSKAELDLELRRIGDWRRLRANQQAAKAAKGPAK